MSSYKRLKSCSITEILNRNDREVSHEPLTLRNAAETFLPVPPPGGERSMISESVGPSVCPGAYLLNHMSSPNFYACPTHGHGSVLLWRRCDAVRSYVGLLPVSLMTSCFPIMGPIWRHFDTVQRRRCIVVRRLTPLLLGVGCILS